MPKVTKKISNHKKVVYLPLEREAFVYIKIIYNNISMYLDQKAKEEIFKKHGGDAKNTGSAQDRLHYYGNNI